MAHFAKVQLTATPGIYTVVDVIVADQSFVDTQPGTWIQTSYNTYGNVHYAPSPPAEPRTPDGGTPMRANYAGIGYTYDTSYTIGEYLGVFYSPKPTTEGDWVLNTSTFLWENLTPTPVPVE